MFVLDCSVALAWCLADEQSDYADKVLDLLMQQQAIVPSLWHLEIANVLLMAQKRGRVTQQNSATILQTLSNANIITHKRNPTIADIDFVYFAHKHQLTSYDASYLYLAKTEKIPLATLDKKLTKVANDIGLFLSV
ncbi:MAG: type II toxin-antitoxin system VapC family toxin [Candidatus Thioglobus sp.]|nr:MAG: type II toxin-antitoxin system VapC family toxin [Candidatus Thioglobus sp.]